MKRFAIDDKGVGTYVLVGASKAADGTEIPAMAFSVDLEKSFGWSTLADLPRKAIAFAIAHVLRNATAGKMDDAEKAKGFKDAADAINERIKALDEGKWTAHRETGEAGESRNSLVAQALAVVMGVEPQAAAEFISNEIRNALEEKNIDPDADSDDLNAEQKTERRKIANAVRKSISDDPGVSVEMQKLKLARDAAKLAETQKAAEGKVSAFTKAAANPATPA